MENLGDGEKKAPHSNSRGADEIRSLTISIDFQHRNTELLLLFSILTPCNYKVDFFYAITSYILCAQHRKEFYFAEM